MTLTGLRRAVETAVLLPGTGSDEVFVRSVFAGPLTSAGLRVEAPRPCPGAELAARHIAVLDAAARRHGTILAGGISFGAHLAAEWAVANPDRCAGLLLAMPGWLGPPGAAPGSVAALTGADAVDADGIDRTIAAAVAGVPGWLARELDRSWRRAGDGLAESLRVAARRPAPTPELLGRLTVPAGVAGCVDDPVHPVAVARQWAEALPSAVLRTITFAELGADPAVLGRAALAGLDLAVRVHDQVGDDDRHHDDGREHAEQQR
ncbi:MAG TPA: alpha/beta hydrolase [Pseudonocardiaceae bacterium]|nr:alpha/beta hydrolase [Pseudonocardiaceae bacterium]